MVQSEGLQPSANRPGMMGGVPPTQQQNMMMGVVVCKVHKQILK